MILMNGSYDTGCVDQRIAQLSASKEKIVVPGGPTNRKWRQHGQFAVARENKIIDRIVARQPAAIAGERHKLFTPLRVGKTSKYRRRLLLMATFFAFLHHGAAFTLVSALAVEFVLIRQELRLASARRLPIVDASAGFHRGRFQ
jgi:hypothetical protein